MDTVVDIISQPNQVIASDQHIMNFAAFVYNITSRDHVHIIYIADNQSLLIYAAGPILYEFVDRMLPLISNFSTCTQLQIRIVIGILAVSNCVLYLSHFFARYYLKTNI